jgi:hypothetical protein
MADTKPVVIGQSQPVVVQAQPLGGAVVEPTKEFKLKAGKSHSHDGASLQGGDVVHLNSAQAVAFRDKFDAVDEKAPFKVFGPEVHQAAKSKVAEREAQARGVGPVTPGNEAAQAQKDKAAAEAKSSGSGAQAVSTFDATAGTLTKDPGPKV